MPFIESVDHLTEYRRQVRAQRDPEQLQVLVCGGPGCLPLGSEELAAAFQTEMAAKGLEGKVLLKTTGCQGLCSHGVRVLIRPREITYQKVTPADVPEIVDTTLVNNQMVERLLYHDPDTQAARPHKSDIPFYQAQNPLVLRKLDVIDPESLDDYLAFGGYRTLRKILFTMTPEQVIDAVEKSGLRGRGGGGFPTGRKWRVCREAAGDVKFIICNGDEGDPGAFMDRAVLEGDPHSVIEGMIIGAYAIGAPRGYIYVRHEYPLAVQRLHKAVEQAREFGFLGNKILRLRFQLRHQNQPGRRRLRLRRGNRSHCLHRRQDRRTHAPPALSGPGRALRPAHRHQQRRNLGQCPRHYQLWGADWFAAIGTETSKGTKIFSLVGTVNNTGLVEVPMGTTLRQIIFDIGGGIPHDREFKAVQTGGPSGGCIPSQFLDLPVDYDSLQQVGSIMGSGGMIVMDEP